jgi:hypothetical protein
MKGRWSLAAMMLVLAAPLEAQARTTISVMPIASYVLPSGDWTDNDSLRLAPGGGVAVGLSAEVSLGKTLSVTGEVSRTLGLTQHLDAEIPAFEDPSAGIPGVLRTDLTTTSLAGTVVFRPMGRLPNGLPRGVFIEAGGTLVLYNVGTGFQPTSGSEELDFNWSTVAITGGAGVAFPAGRRFAIQVFGRALVQLSEHGSQGLDDWNSIVGTSVVGEKSLLLQFGVGLRVGR